MKLNRYRHKVYLRAGPWEIQYGRITHSIAVFRQQPWHRLFAIDWWLRPPKV